MEKSNKFCIRPFTSVAIGATGNINPCCSLNKKLTRFKNKKVANAFNGINKYHNSKYSQYLRKKFLNNEAPEECQTCWDQEARGFESERIRKNNLHKVLFKKNYEKYLKLIKKYDLKTPIEINLAMTNLCNLKCLMCDGTSSSQLLIENFKLGYETDLVQKDFDWTILAKQKIIDEILKNNSLEYLNLTGGETLMVPEIFRLLDKLKNKNLKIVIFTNGTQYNERIVSKLKQLKNLHIIFSVESTNKQNEYIRFPSAWNNIQRNIINLQKDLPKTIFNINCMVQNLNILYLDQLINFAHNHNLHLILNTVKSPEYLIYTNLPLSLLEKSYNKLCNIPKEKTIHVSNFNNLKNELQNFIKNYKVNNKLFEKFKSVIQSRDKYRKVSIFNYMPELAKEVFTK